MKKKLSLKFVNDGKPFTVSDWTTIKHQEALEELMKNTKNLSQEKQDSEFKFYVIRKGLEEIDDSVSIDDIKKLHPETVVELFSIIYYAGKSDIFFRQTKSKRKSKK